MNGSTLIVVLAWNESACIADTVSELRRAQPEADLLVVDDGSSDETAARARSAGARVVRHPINLGVAAAEATGLRYALRRGYELVIRVDGDGQHDPASLPALLEAIRRGNDLAIGSRLLDGRPFEGSLMRRLGSAFLANILTTLAGQRICDPTSGLRAFSPRAAALLSTTVAHDYPEPESVLYAVRRGLRVVEVPAVMRPRCTGHSSLTPLTATFYMVKVSFALLLERMRTVEEKP